MRSGLLLLLVAAMIAAGCRSVSYQAADSAAVEPAVLSYQETALADALAAFLQGRLVEEEYGQGATQALPYYQSAAEKSPGSHTVYSRIAIEGMHRGDLDASIAAMETSHAAQTNDPTRQMDLGAMYQLAYRLEEAAKLFEQALVHQPTNTALYVTLSDIYFTHAQDSKAFKLLEDGFSKASDPETLSTYLHQHARRFVTRGELPRAIDALEVLAAWSDDRAETYFMIGELHIAQEARSDAAAALYRSIELPNAPAAAYLRLASLLLEKNKREEAISAIEAGYGAYPHLISFPASLGGLYFEQEKYEDALLAYESAVQLAIEHEYREARETTHSSKNLLIAKGAAQERLQQFEKAAETMEKVLNQYPDSHIAMNFLAYMWAELDKNLADAYELSQRSLEMDPDNGAYLDTLGWIYYRKGKYDQALKYLQKALDQLGPDAEVILHFGDVYAAKGDMQRAKEYWIKSIREDPTPRNRAWTQLKSIEVDPEQLLKDDALDDMPDEDTKQNPEEDNGPHEPHDSDKEDLHDDKQESDADPTGEPSKDTGDAD